ncbi:MAG: sugar phosphate isomerase/epimerase, partial [Desulfobacterales bacterium]|nr:sugar phosphate isomerase/epimerase [Desulfobacterales bacterium]
MNTPVTRRTFLARSSVMLGALTMAPAAFAAESTFKISLAEWSLHRALRANQLTNLDFPKVARGEFGIEAVEYVNQFFKDKATDRAYLSELKGICDGEGVRSVLIMCDGEGQLGDPDEARRRQAVENHHKWVSAAQELGCHSIRVNAATGGQGSYEEQQKRAADGLHALADYATPFNINVIVENHGGLSSDGAWLAGVMKRVNLPNCGTLPDFGNFRLGEGKEYDRYQGTKELMPFAKGVSAKSYDFDKEGNETTIDYPRMLKIVMQAGYHGYIGIEYEGSRLDEYEGIRATQRLLERVRG